VLLPGKWLAACCSPSSWSWLMFLFELQK
jgi:hypothetical protein